jgi:predicted RNA-binding protein
MSFGDGRIDKTFTILREIKGMPRNYWMMVLSLENFSVLKKNKFSVYGFRAKLKKRVDRMEIGDRVLFYLSHVQGFPATATITSTMYEDDTELFSTESGKEAFPYRVSLEPGVILDESNYIDARQLGPTLEYVKKWVPERWPLAFIGELHLIPKKDLFLVEDEMKRTSSIKSLPRAFNKMRKSRIASQNGEGR